MQTILIIDDDAAIGNLEQEVLERAGYAVLRAYSGTEALLLLKDSRPDLVLLDLMLPGLSGEEVLPQLLKKVSYTSLDEMYAAIGYGGMAATRAVNRMKDELARLHHASGKKTGLEKVTEAAERRERQTDLAVFDQELFRIGFIQVDRQKLDAAARGSAYLR